MVPIVVEKPIKEGVNIYKNVHSFKCGVTLASYWYSHQLLQRWHLCRTQNHSGLHIAEISSAQLQPRGVFCQA